MPSTLEMPTSADQLDRLARLTTTEPEIVSCYVRLDPAARFRQRYLVEMKRRVREVHRHLEAVPVDAAVRAAVGHDLDRIIRWLSAQGNLPAQAGVALFASERNDLFEIIPLPRVHRNRLALDRFAALQELADAQETLGHYLAVVSDRTHARLFRVGPDGTEELSGLALPSIRGGKYRPDRRDAPGWGERDYHQRLRTEAQRHYRAIADEVVREIHRRPVSGIALFGPTEHTTGLTGYLPLAAERLLLGRGKLNPTAVSPAEVGKATWELQRRHETEAEAALLDQVDEKVAAGFAVVGVRETLRALGRGQVRILIVPDGQVGAGFRCRDTGRLTLTRAECRGEGEADPVINLVDAAIDDALRSGAEVRVIDDPEVSRRVDGMAALLRFRSR